MVWGTLRREVSTASYGKNLSMASIVAQFLILQVNDYQQELENFFTSKEAIEHLMKTADVNLPIGDWYAVFDVPFEEAKEMIAEIVCPLLPFALTVCRRLINGTKLNDVDFFFGSMGSSEA
ncbi:hypothetical protein DXG01_010864 [Tephrocybe rancida]|nr:hypothetical protein DXG01_010864 [Tephrocybe rancida]